MEKPLVDVVLLGLLVTFFGILQYSRPQRYFRFWFTGWMLVFCSVLTWKLRFFTPSSIVQREVLRDYILFAGGLAFLLSFLAGRNDARRTAIKGLLAAVPALALFLLTNVNAPGVFATCCVVLALEGALIHLTVHLLPKEWTKRRALLASIAVLNGALMMALAGIGRWHAIETRALAQVYFSCAILYAGTVSRRRIEWFAGVLGFAGWALFYPLRMMFQHQPELLSSLLQLWDLPKYAVGFAMMLRIFESARHEVEEIADRYRDLYEDFRMVFDNHPLPMWIVDVDSMAFLSANAAACASYGYTLDEFLKMGMREVMVAPEPISGSRLVRLEKRSGEPAPASTSGSRRSSETPAATRARHRLKNGNVIAVEITEHDVLFQGRKARFVLAMDVTEREKLNQALENRAHHDALTGLPNRMLLEDRILQCVERSKRDQKRSVLFTMDVDRFKLINDIHGHLVGDECLKAIAERLRTRIRSVDTIARTGGEEFTAIIGGLHNADDAEKIASAFLRLFDSPLELPGQELKVSISIGAALYPDDAVDAEGLRKKSDQALYHAKRFGRNRFAFASNEVCASFDQAMAVELAIREALRSDGFELHFQPIYNNAGKASRFEALMRMKSTCPHVYDPSLFIPVAEECGLIVPLGNWLVRQACSHVVDWRHVTGEDLSVAINVSGKQFLQKSFNCFVLETLREHGLPAHALEMELTETSLMIEPTLMRETIAELAGHGVRFSIDDFGTGYSSLAHIADLPISGLKIDRSFIAQLDHAKRKEGIVTAIIQMAQTLQVSIVAEGVEEEAQLNHLLRRGCDFFQGFYLSPALPPSDLLAGLKQGSLLLNAHPRFSKTRVAVSKRVRQTGAAPRPSLALPTVTQLPVLAGGADGTA